MQNIDTCGGATLAAPAAPGGEHAEQAAEAERLLAGLPDNQREALRLKFHHGLSYKEIAHTMGLTSNYVGVLIHNGLTALRGQMTTRA